MCTLDSQRFPFGKKRRREKEEERTKKKKNERRKKKKKEERKKKIIYRWDMYAVPQNSGLERVVSVLYYTG